MKVGVLTAGGDCPGLNAAISTIGRLAERDGNQAVGFRHGFRGLAEGELVDLSSLDLPRAAAAGGTVLGASSFDPFRESATGQVTETVSNEGIDAVIVIGGEHSMEVASRLSADLDLPVVGIPKTIDNDVTGTEFTLGFDTAVQIATEAIDRVKTTAESHDRVIVVEVMGRNTGWIALWSAIASAADIAVIPEVETTVPRICERVRDIHEGGKDFSIVVVAEGASLAPSPGEGKKVLISTDPDPYGYERLGGIAVEMARAIALGTGFETRATILGHVQRGGAPTAADRVLATRLATSAYDAALSQNTGRMAALEGSEVVLVPLSGVSGVKLCDPEKIAAAERLGLL